MDLRHVRRLGTGGRVLGALARFLKVRYLILTGAVCGGVAANNVSVKDGIYRCFPKYFEKPKLIIKGYYKFQ